MDAVDLTLPPSGGTRRDGIDPFIVVNNGRIVVDHGINMITIDFLGKNLSSNMIDIVLSSGNLLPIATEHGHRKFVGLPNLKMVMLHSYM